jgi:hypothetical protein
VKIPARCLCGNEAIGKSCGAPVCARCARIEGGMLYQIRRGESRPLTSAQRNARARMNRMQVTEECR